MNYILDVGLPAASWLGIITVAIIGILSWTAKKVIDNIEKEVANVVEDIKNLKLDLQKISEKLDIELRKMDSKLNDVSKQVDARITSLNLNILDKLDDIKGKFYDLRK